jgi:hypothetical protein
VLRLGLFDHFGWAVAVTASVTHDVVDRRRIELVEPGITPAPFHYESARLDDASTAALVTDARASIARVSASVLDGLAADLSAPIVSVSLRSLPDGFPTDIAVLRRPPYEARADAVMYRQVLVELARDRGWAVHLYDAKKVVAQATAVLADRAGDVLDGPRASLGPPWTKEHRIALAATVIAG